MSKFFEELKQLLIEQTKETEGFDACGYFNVILQHQDKVSELVNTYEENECYLTYHKDETGGYTDGKIQLYHNDDNDCHFEIMLSSHQTWHGYCECKPGDQGYIAAYDCCGYCDWFAPSFSVEKISFIDAGEFRGYAKDMCDLREDWNKELGIFEEDKMKEKITQIDEQIAVLQKRKDALLNQ